jgi:phospholipid/cholesterol/gamma-HCH transport system permease protein
LDHFLSIHQGEGGTSLMLSGEWNLGRIRDIDAQLSAARLPASPVTLDGTGLDALDTAAALALVLRLAAAGSSVERTVGLKSSHSSVIQTVSAQLLAPGSEPPRTRRGAVASLGAAAVALLALMQGYLDFAGRCAAALAELAAHPRRTRWKELAAQLQHVCIEAIPVVALVTFLIGSAGRHRRMDRRIGAAKHGAART